MYPTPPRSRLFPLLVVLASVLAVALVVTGALGYRRIAALRQQVATLVADREAQQRRDETAAAQLNEDFRSADLKGKLQRVKDLDRAADAVFAKWDDGTVKFGAVDDAMNACDDAIDEYNRAAARFPVSMLGGLPERVNLANPETDCGRAFTAKL